MTTTKRIPEIHGMTMHELAGFLGTDVETVAAFVEEIPAGIRRFESAVDGTDVLTEAAEQSVIRDFEQEQRDDERRVDEAARRAWNARFPRW